MLDLVMIRKHPEEVAALLARKGVEIDFTDFLAADEERRSLIYKNEQLSRTQQNFSRDS